MNSCYYIVVSSADKTTKQTVNTKFAIPAGSVEQAKEIASKYGEFVYVEPVVHPLGKGWQ